MVVVAVDISGVLVFPGVTVVPFKSTHEACTAKSDAAVLVTVIESVVPRRLIMVFVAYIAGYGFVVSHFGNHGFRREV